MLNLRAVLLAFALVIASVTNVFFAPSIYSPRAPVFSGPDVAENFSWRGHGYSFQPSWLAERLPNSRFTQMRFGRPDGFVGDGIGVGIFWNERTAVIEGVAYDDTDFPLDLSGLGVGDALVEYHQIFSGIRCQSDPSQLERGRCDYFVAWDGTVAPTDQLVFVAVFTRISPDGDEVGFVEEGLLSRLLSGPINDVPTVAEREG